MNKQLIYDCRWSKDCDIKFIDDFNSVQDQVFKGEHTRETFKHQYLDNPYGHSVLVVVYDDGIPVAARGLWRDDLNGLKAYQTGRVCVLPPYRRFYLVFMAMTKCAMSLVDDNAILYSFPNQYSYPAYEKLGWNTISELYLKLFIREKEFERENPEIMDVIYHDWWINKRDNGRFRIFKRGKSFFLVKRIKPICYEIISKVDESIAKQYPKIPFISIVFYNSIKKTIYNKRIMPNRVVCNKKDVIRIPKWKIDAI